MSKSILQFVFVTVAAAAAGGCGDPGDTDEQHAYVREESGLIEVDPGALGGQPTSPPGMEPGSESESLSVEGQDGTVCDGWCTATYCSCKGPTWCCNWLCAQCVDL